MIMAQTAADGSGKEATSSTILTKKDKEVLIGELKASNNGFLHTLSFWCQLERALVGGTPSPPPIRDESY